MKPLFTIPLVLMSLVSFPSWGLSMDDLVQREGLYYQKFTDVPFTGEVDEGLKRGSIINGKKEGSWKNYHSNGQLNRSGTYINGEEEGYWFFYHSNGILFAEGEIKNGENQGLWSYYDTENGNLLARGLFKDSLRQGWWEFFNEDGTLDYEATGTYKNSLKVSD